MLNIDRLEFKCPCGAEYSLVTTNDSYNIDITCQCKRFLSVYINRDVTNIMYAELKITRIPSSITDNTRFQSIKVKNAFVSLTDEHRWQHKWFKLSRYKNNANLSVQCENNQAIGCILETVPDQRGVTKQNLFFLLVGTIDVLAYKNVLRFPQRKRKED